jgi:S-disulfanyl-L-cysteine oxidoreductase SoxD
VNARTRQSRTRTLKRAFHVATMAASTALAAAQSTTSVWDGVFSEEQARRGEVAYRQYCAACHGVGLEGGDMTPPLIGGAFTSNWNDLTVGDLFERIRVTMPLDEPGKLSRQQNVDVIAFVLKTNTWPAGATELPPEPGSLKQVRIEASKR